MPELDICTPSGKLKIDAYAKVVAAMHFPTDRVRRERLQYAYESGDILNRLHSAINEENSLDLIRDDDFEKLHSARNLGELEPRRRKLYQDGYLAAHWLVFRLYAHQQQNDIGSNGKWYSYVENNLMPELNKIRKKSGKNLWAEKYDSIRKSRLRFGPVAHLWAACVYEKEFTDLMMEEPSKLGQSLDPLFHFSVNRANKLIPMLRRAQAYLHAAQAIGLIAEEADPVWTIPAAIAPSQLPVFTNPDHFISNFDVEKFRREYKSRFYAANYGEISAK